MSLPPSAALTQSSPPQQIKQLDQPNRPSRLNMNVIPTRSSSLSHQRKMPPAYPPSPPPSTTPRPPNTDLLSIDQDNQPWCDHDADVSSDCTLFREVALDEGLRAARPFRGMPARPEAMSHADLVRLTRALYMDGMHLRRTVLQLSQQALYFKAQVEDMCEMGLRRRKESWDSRSSE